MESFFLVVPGCSGMFVFFQVSSGLLQHAPSDSVFANYNFKECFNCKSIKNELRVKYHNIVGQALLQRWTAFLGQLL